MIETIFGIRRKNWGRWGRNGLHPSCKIQLSWGTTGHVDKDLVFLDIHLSQCMKMFPLHSHIRTPLRKLIRFRIHRCHSNYNPLHSELWNKIVKIVTLWSCDCKNSQFHNSKKTIFIFRDYLTTLTSLVLFITQSNPSSHGSVAQRSITKTSFILDGWKYSIIDIAFNHLKWKPS